MRCLLSALLVLGLATPAFSQDNPIMKPPPVTSAPVEQPPGERPPPAPAVAFAILSTLVVLLIVCMPSRKG